MAETHLKFVAAEHKEDVSLDPEDTVLQALRISTAREDAL